MPYRPSAWRRTGSNILRRTTAALGLLMKVYTARGAGAKQANGTGGIVYSDTLGHLRRRPTAMKTCQTFFDVARESERRHRHRSQG